MSQEAIDMPFKKAQKNTSSNKYVLDLSTGEVRRANWFAPREWFHQTFLTVIFDPKKTITCMLLLLLVALVWIDPVLAQSWGGKAKVAVDDTVSNLKLIGTGVALACLLWFAYQMIWGGKRLQDMVGWIIGAIISYSAEEIVNFLFS